MAHNFKEGIDWATDPTGATSLSSHYFVSKSGSDVNAGTSSLLPKLTPNAMLGAIGSGTVIVGTGIYANQMTSANSSKTIKGDGHVVLYGDGVNYAVKTGGKCENVIITNWNDLSDGSVTLTRCLVISNGAFSGAASFINSIFVNQNIDITGTYYADLNYGNMFFNGTVKSTRQIRDSYFHTDTIFEVASESFAALCNNNCIRGQVKIAGVTYANLAAAKVAHPTAFPNSFDSDPLFLGSPSQYEFIVASNSPLIGVSSIGVNIGNAKQGIIQNDASTEFTTGATANNTAFVSGSLELTSGTSSYRESGEIDLGRLVKSPTIRLNGIVDFINHTPDALNLLTNPNHLDFTAQWAGKDGVYNGTWKTFRYNQPMYLNADGKTTGELDFDWSDLGEIDVRYIKIRVYIRDDYNES